MHRELLMFQNLYIQTGAYYVVAWNKLYKSEILKKVQYQKGKLHEDEFTTYRAVYDAKKMVFTDEKLYYYFQHGSGIMTEIAKKQIERLNKD